MRTTARSQTKRGKYKGRERKQIHIHTHSWIRTYDSGFWNVQDRAHLSFVCSIWRTTKLNLNIHRDIPSRIRNLVSRPSNAVNKTSRTDDEKLISEEKKSWIVTVFHHRAKKSHGGVRWTSTLVASSACVLSNTPIRLLMPLIIPFFNNNNNNKFYSNLILTLRKERPLPIYSFVKQYSYLMMA
jgi:hypothetical protein